MIDIDHRTIQYFLNNAALDALSRREELKSTDHHITKYGFSAMATGISTSVHSFLHDLQQTCVQDPDTNKILQLCAQGKPPSQHFRVVNDQLLYKDRVYVPACNDWRAKVISEMHDGYNGGMQELLEP